MLIYICDDDKVQLIELRKYIEKYSMENDIVMDIKTYCSVETMMMDMSVEKSEIDIFVLDVELEKYNGVEVAEKIRINNKMSDIIFISSYEKYVFDVFSTSPADYITKPINTDKLNKTLERICEKKNNIKTIRIICERKELNIPVEEILFIEGNGHKLNVYLKNDTYTVYDKMDYIEEKIKELSPLFVRIHKSYLGNYRYVTEVKSDKVTLCDGRELSVSRKYKDELRQFSMKCFEMRLDG